MPKRYRDCKITEAGREALAVAEGDGAGGVERVVYVKVILVLIDGGKALQLSAEDIERIKEAVRLSPLAKLREIVASIGTLIDLTKLGALLAKAFLGD